MALFLFLKQLLYRPYHSLHVIRSSDTQDNLPVRIDQNVSPRTIRLAPLPGTNTLNTRVLPA